MQSKGSGLMRLKSKHDKLHAKLTLKASLTKRDVEVNMVNQRLNRRLAIVSRLK
jgi:hypothetical protein